MNLYATLGAALVLSLSVVLSGGKVLEPSAVPTTVTVLFGGDMMFDRSVRSASAKKGGDFIFSCLDPILAGQDLVVANLEGPITENASISEYSEPGDGNNYTFTFPTSTAELLHRHNVQMVNLGNNHILNFKHQGLVSTQKYLEAAGVGYFGAPNTSNPVQIARSDIRGIPLSFVNWNEWGIASVASTTETIQHEVRDGRVVIVYAHWGEEYVGATKYQKALAHTFADAGASIIIGSHPHVIQEYELYTSTSTISATTASSTESTSTVDVNFAASTRQTHIFYSLGNLIFDQYWEPAVTKGLMLEVQFDAGGVKAIKEIPVTLQKDRRTCPTKVEATQFAIS